MQQKMAMKLLSIAMCLSIAMPVFAESAPVYDVDSMQQSMDSSSVEQGQELPLPPEPGQEANASPGNVPALAPSAPPSPSPSVPMTNNVASSATDQRVRRLEDQVKNLQTNSSAARVDSLQQEMQTLRGQVDELTHQLQQAQNQQKSMYADLDKRVATNKQAPAEAAPIDVTPPTDNEKAATKTAAAATAAKTARALSATKLASATKSTSAASSDSSANQQPDVAEEQQIYQTAYNLIKAKKYNEAINALQGMLKKYPTGQFASNAHYWLGELYGLVGKHDQALTEFNVVVKSYASSPRVADAQLKVGLIYASQVKWADAKAAFKKVINHYPGSAPAKLAATQLKQIKDAGH